MVKTFGIITLCLVVLAGCGNQEEPNAANNPPSSMQNPPAETPNEPAMAAEPAEEPPASIPAARVTIPEPVDQVVQGQTAQVPPTMPPVPTKLGDPAFPLVGLTTLKGEPVEIKPGKVYVVEFWATWCIPCRTTIPHLTELAKKYEDQGVVVIGITNEDAGAVEPFISDMGDKMDYNVAIDAIGGVGMGYMLAFQQGNIPTAFIVDREGRVAWYGHPLNLDPILAQVIAGTYKIPG